ncbi:hypothetical protein WG954_17270 [Lacibacter sp. H375]|uniref:hypothetical protein n=1 Tax=Lacibacter sp. H375 TaxID=3133424 RepID=UPI0030C01762
MKTYLSFILFFVAFSANAQQQQEVYKLDSCLQFGTNPFDDIYVRVQQTAKWKAKKPSLESHIEKFFEQYTQKKAGGKITISILIDKTGKPCTYEARPNSNVRPDFQQLKAWMNQYDWEPAIQNGQPVRSIKILQVNFEGKKVSVAELD